jgi:ABC-type transport system involved in multi-copper enzyme maturation permease subunit
MDAPAAVKRVRINRLLPYWAVFQSDVHQTMRSWVYRTWVLVSVLAAVGYLLYHVGIYQRAGIIQPASTLVGELLRWTVLGSVTLIIVLTAGSISSERGTMADSVLSRGISRYQYFLGKWHARLATILGTYFVMGILALAGGFFLLHEDLQWTGGLMALATVAALLAAVVSCGVTISAMVNSTVLGIAILWFALYGTGFALSLLPVRIPSPDRLLTQLPDILRGYHNIHALGRMIGWSAIASVSVCIFGLGYFARRDV